MIINKLNECLNSTHENDINHIIAKFIKKNLNQLPAMKIDDLAESCYVSKAKISGFCKKMGYDNFQALKKDCLKEIEAKQVVQLRQNFNLRKEYNLHIDDSLKVIKDNLHHVNIDHIQQLVNDINKAKHIFIYGVAYSHLLCQYFQYECEFLNKEVIVMDEMLNGNYIIDNQSLVIVLTVEGYCFKADERLLRKIKRLLGKKWCLSTDYLEKEVQKEFDNSLIIPSQGTEIKDRRILLRYMIDIILGRYQYLYM